LDNENNLKVKPAAEIKTGDKVALINNFKSANEIKEIYLPKFLAGNVPIDKQNEIRIVNAEDFFKKLVNRIGEKELRKILDIKGFNNLADWYGVVPLDQVNKLIEEKFINWDEIPKTAKIRTIFNPKEWDLNIKITEDLLWILGCYAAEGYSRQSKSVSQIAFRIMDKNQMKKLAKSVGSAFGLKVSFGEDKTKITICDKMVYYLFKYCFRTGSSAYEKRVPDIVFNVSENLVKNYLSAFFDGDGTIIYGNKRKCICFYSVSRELLDGISLLGCSFGLFGRFQKTKERLPGRKILERYKELNKEPKKHILNHLVYTGKDFYAFAKILKSVSKTKNAKIKSIVFKEAKERRINNSGKILNLGKVGDIYLDFIKSVEFIRDNKNSYCFEVDWNSEEEKNVLWGEQIINARCDGDEAALMLLMDVLINFSRSFLPSHRGGTQDAPLVLNGKISAKEVDDQILDLELVNNYPLEMYEKAEKKSHSSEIKIEMVKQRIGRDEDPYVNTGFTHDCSNFNQGATCSSYKTLPTMQDKVRAQMDLCVKLRGVDQGDVARLIIDRHFMKDLKGNLRKFSQQNFRCGKCNEIYRRPPLNGKCEHCGNPKLIFTISYGSIVKYLEPALDLINNFKVPAYIQQDLELTKKYIESIFGRDTEKQESIEKWF
jgi:DNA polymerase II large subunit